MVEFDFIELIQATGEGIVAETVRSAWTRPLPIPDHGEGGPGRKGALSPTPHPLFNRNLTPMRKQHFSVSAAWNGSAEVLVGDLRAVGRFLFPIAGFTRMAGAPFYLKSIQSGTPGGGGLTSKMTRG